MSDDQTTYKTLIYSHQLSVFLLKSVRTLNRFRKLRGRNAGYPAPPAQSRTCGFPASGSSVVLASAQSLINTQTLAASFFPLSVALLFLQDPAS